MSNKFYTVIAPIFILINFVLGYVAYSLFGLAATEEINDIIVAIMLLWVVVANIISVIIIKKKNGGYVSVLGYLIFMFAIPFILPFIYEYIAYNILHIN